MPSYRVTVRHGGERPRYEMIDLEADDLRGALRTAADRLGDEVAATAELAEVRRQADPDEREYVGEDDR